MAKFQPGHAKIPGSGRRVGQISKSTERVREAIALFAEDNAPKLAAWLAEIEDPAKRIELYLRAIEYHVPKLARTEHVGEGGGPMKITISKDQDNL